MLQYYRNPKTEELIIWDSNENNIVILGRVKKIQVFLEDDILHPSKKNDDQVVGDQSYFGEQAVKKTPNKKRKGKHLSLEEIKKIKEMKKEGATIKEITEEVGVSSRTIYNYL